MSKTKTPRKLKSNKNVTRHIVGDQIRYTVKALLVDYPHQQWEKLVAIATCGATSEQFIWICKGFST